MSQDLTCRQVLARGAAGCVSLGAASVLSNPLVADALAAPRACGMLADIEHVVILIQENRSFDHYFGSYRGGRGFADPGVERLSDGSGLTIFAQPGYPGGYDVDHLYPFHVDSFHNGECTNDINHSWGPQHSYWDGGKLDGFVSGSPRGGRAGQRSSHDGLLHTGRPGLLLRARGCVHDLRPLPLLGNRADGSQPALLDGRVARSRRQGRWANPQHQRHARRPLRHAHLHHDARAAPSGPVPCRTPPPPPRRRGLLGQLLRTVRALTESLSAQLNGLLGRR